MPTNYDTIALIADRSGSTSSTDSIIFYYQSSSYQSIQSGALVTFQANTIEATPSGAYGELDIIISTSSSIQEKGTSIMKLLHTGSTDEPRVAIGFASNEKPTKSFEIKTKIDSDQATQFVLQSARPSKGAEIGDSAGKITFAIASESFEDIFSTGAIGEIDTVVIGTGSGNNMSGNVRIKASPEYIEILENVAEFGFKKRSGDPFNPNTTEDSSAILHISGALIVGFDESSQGDVAPLEVWGKTVASQFPSTPQLVQTGSEFHLLSSSLHVGSGSIFLGDAYGNTSNEIEFVNFRGQDPVKLGQVSGGAGSLHLDLYSNNTHHARLDTSGNFRVGTSTSTINDKLEVEGNISASGELTVLSASIDRLDVNNRLQGNGSGFQFFAFNEDTVKLKFANWYGSNTNQYGMGMLWYENWFGAIDTDGDANDVNRRIGFYLELPDAGASDAAGGTGQHPSNARFFVDVTGSYVNSGSLTVTDADFKVSSSGAVTSQGYAVVSQSSAFTDNEFIIADGTGAVTSTDALAVSASNLGIGTNSPTVRLHMVGEGQGTTQILMQQYNNTEDAPDIRTRRYRGTEASPQDVQAGDYLFRFNVHGQDGGSSQLYGSMQFDVDSSDQDALEWRLQTRDTTSTNDTRLTIDKDGNAEFSGSLAIQGISNVSESIADAAGGGGAVATYTNGVNNRIITSTGTDGINGESTLTYNGAILSLNGTLNFPPGTANNGISTRVDNQWESTTLENNGEYIQVGTAIARNQHRLYNLGSSGWVQADADATTTSIGLLGIVVDSNSGNDFLVKGIYNTNIVDGTTPAIGDPVYVSTTAGRVTVDAPTAASDVVRCCGHIIDTWASGRTTYYKIYFNPSPDFIEN